MNEHLAPVIDIKTRRPITSELDIRPLVITTALLDLDYHERQRDHHEARILEIQQYLATTAIKRNNPTLFSGDTPGDEGA